MVNSGARRGFCDGYHYILAVSAKVPQVSAKPSIRREVNIYLPVNVALVLIMRSVASFE